MDLKQPIILCGFTSSGKTTIGQLLAKELDLPFFDTDQMITEQNHMTIREIFDKGGETLFRDMEHEIAAQVSGVCHFLAKSHKYFSLFCKVFLAFFVFLCYNLCIGI